MSKQTLGLATARPNSAKIDASIRAKKVITSTLIHLVLSLMALLMIFPLLWLVSTSLKEPSKQMLWPPQIIPNRLSRPREVSECRADENGRLGHWSHMRIRGASSS